ncbi:MAG TPA: methylamine utilization protein [Myxococcota bacterium]|nr:methylamine utilization protein [Myxococcota bacterium]
MRVELRIEIARRQRRTALACAIAFFFAPHAILAGSAEIQVRDAAGAPVVDAVVSLVPADGSAAPPASPAPAGAREASASMDQRNIQFAPHVLAVQRGAAVDFPNSDQIRHHVYSFSEAKRFELRLYSGVPAEPVVFDQAGTVVLGCNIHDDMIGFIRVLDTPWYATTGEPGLAHIANVPPGRYKVELWHPRAQDASADLVLEVAEGAPVHLDAPLRLGPEPTRDRPKRLLRDRLRDGRGP